VKADQIALTDFFPLRVYLPLPDYASRRVSFPGMRLRGIIDGLDKQASVINQISVIWLSVSASDSTCQAPKMNPWGRGEGGGVITASPQLTRLAAVIAQTIAGSSQPLHLTSLELRV
jgi:hypothetical protein